SKLANHFMIDSSTLSLFSFQRAFSLSPRGDFFNLPHIHSIIQVFFSFFRCQYFVRAAATFVNIACPQDGSQ
ncbi:hypothetical protein, partial [Brevibacillus agri]|uniref:hypothetical protein n=1 Tax=Brevibacillus agri TaxID=51101 RepID=UPI003D2433FA